jgi:hypothetical protein
LKAFKVAGTILPAGAKTMALSIGEHAAITAHCCAFNWCLLVSPVTSGMLS